MSRPEYFESWRVNNFSEKQTRLIESGNLSVQIFDGSQLSTFSTNPQLVCRFFIKEVSSSNENKDIFTVYIYGIDNYTVYQVAESFKNQESFIQLQLQLDAQSKEALLNQFKFNENTRSNFVFQNEFPESVAAGYFNNIKR